MPIQIQSVCCGMIGENAWIGGLEGRDDCVVIDPGDVMAYEPGEEAEVAQ